MSQGPWLMHLLLQRLPNYGMCLPLVRSEMILGGTWTWHQRALDHTVKSYFLSITSKRKISDWYLQDSNSSLNLLTYFPLPHQWSLFPKSVKGIRLPELTKSTKTVLYHKFNSGCLLLYLLIGVQQDLGSNAVFLKMWNPDQHHHHHLLEMETQGFSLQTYWVRDSGWGPAMLPRP